MRPLYRELADAIQAKKNCQTAGNTEWLDRWDDTIKLLVNHLPSGSGISGTTLDEDSSHAEKLVFTFSFYHMNDNGYYDGWTEHTLTVTPSFDGINLRISGRNRNDIKDYLYEMYHYALTQDVTYWLMLEHFLEYEVTSKWEDQNGNPSKCYQTWYVNGQAFFNNPSKAYETAAALMVQAQNDKRNVSV